MRAGAGSVSRRRKWTADDVVATLEETLSVFENPRGRPRAAGQHRASGARHRDPSSLNPNITTSSGVLGALTSLGAFFSQGFV